MFRGQSSVREIRDIPVDDVLLNPSHHPIACMHELLRHSKEPESRPMQVEYGQ